MKTIKEKIGIMQACEEGKKIQCRGLLEEDWHDIGNNPLWNWGDTDYRVKPEPKLPTYRLYDSTDELIADYKARFNVDNPPHTLPFIWIKQINVKQDKGTLISSFADDRVWLCGISISHSLKDLFKCYAYLDGPPVGKLME